MKTCKKCQVGKPEDEFYRANKGSSLFPECKECNRVRAREWQRKARAAEPGRARRINLWHLYRMTPETFDALLASQGGGCAICGTTEPGKKGFSVDHCHKEGQVRGLLCGSCNTALGLLKEDPDRITSALAYLLRNTDVLTAVIF